MVGCHQILVLETGKVCSKAGNLNANLGDYCKSEVGDLFSTILTKPASFSFDQVIERGSHHELVELGGKYAEMWKIQNREEEENKDQDDDSGGGDGKE